MGTTIYLGRNIRYLRRKHGWSQEYLAQILGYKSFTSIQRWEANDTSPPVKVVQRLAELFGVDIESLTLIDLELGYETPKRITAYAIALEATYAKLNNKGRVALKEYADYLSTKPEYLKDGEEV